VTRRSTPKELPDAVRDAVERTVQATAGSAERSRDRAQGAFGDVVDRLRGAEAGISRGRKAVTGAMPATHEDIRELKAELRKIGRRLDAIEERLPAKRKAAAKRKPAAKRTTSS